MSRLIMQIVIVSLLALLTGCAGTAGQGSSVIAQDSDGLSAGAGEPENASDQVAVMFINGMACPQCSYNVDLQLKKVSGVERVRVNMAIGRVEAWLSPENPPTRQQLADAIEQTTFTLVSLRMPGEPGALR